MQRHDPAEQVRLLLAAAAALKQIVDTSDIWELQDRSNADQQVIGFEELLSAIRAGHAVLNRLPAATLALLEQAGRPSLAGRPAPQRSEESLPVAPRWRYRTRRSA